MTNEMKLTMKDLYTFQKAKGYEDEPDPSSVGDVKLQLKYWCELLDRMDMRGELPSDLVYLQSFIANLADAEIEYENPLRQFAYIAGVEHCRMIQVYATNEEDADELAKARFYDLARPDARGTGYTEGLSYLERDFGDFRRIVENDR